MQVWRPDTCACVIEQSVSGSGESAVVSMTRFLSKCPAHEALDDVAAYDAVYAGPDGENKRKNQLEAALLASDQLGLSDIQPDGTRTWKPGHAFSWSFTGTGAKRVLNVEVKGAVLDKQATQSLADEVGGEGKVVIV